MQLAVLAGKKTRKTTLVALPIFQPSPLRCQRPSVASATPAAPAARGHDLSLFSNAFFPSPERTSFRASGALFVRRDAFHLGITLLAPSFCPYIITLLFHSLAAVS